MLYYKSGNQSIQFHTNQQQLNHTIMNINFKSSKEDIITGAEEVLDIQQEQINRLRDNQKALMIVIAFFATWAALF